MVEHHLLSITSDAAPQQSLISGLEMEIPDLFLARKEGVLPLKSLLVSSILEHPAGVGMLKE